MKMEFIITTTQNKTKEQYFVQTNTILYFKGLTTNIKGLILFLQNANGITHKIPCSNTNKEFRKDISEFGYVWFEWETTDKEYKIELIVS